MIEDVKEAEEGIGKADSPLPGIPVGDGDGIMNEATEAQGGEPANTHDKSADQVFVDHSARKSTFRCRGTTKRGEDWNAEFTIPHKLPKTLAGLRIWRWHSSTAGGRGGGGGGQKIGEHLAGMFTLYDCLFGPPDPDSFRHILYHDLGELVVSDVNFMAKRRFPELKKILDEREEEARNEIIPDLADLPSEMPWRCKFVDLLDAFTHLVIEHLHGNLMASESILECVAVQMEFLDNVKGRMETEKDAEDWKRAVEETLNPWTHIP